MMRKTTDRLMADYNLCKQRAIDEEIALETAEKVTAQTIKAQEVVQAVAQTVQQQAHERIASVVSRSLEAVFDDPYEFKIIFERKRGRTEARLIFLRDGNELAPIDGAGGGAIQIAAFACRLASIMLTKPPGRRVLVLDEPFKDVSAEYRERLKELLLTLAEEMELQIIMVTHITELQCGTIIKL
jgi:DNA repair exonuclease SbcCD ATPase subunit